MPKIAKELSALAVSRLKDKGHYAVGGVTGLYLYVTNTEAKFWVLRVVIGQKRRHIGLGGFPSVTLAQARNKAREYREMISSGRDPVEDRKATRQALALEQINTRTFEECALAYIQAKQDEWRNIKHRAQWIATLQTYSFPVIGNLDVAKVGLTEVLAVLEPIWKSKTETASRLRGRIESVLDWAAVRGYRDGANPARWKGHLATILQAPSKISKVTSHKALPIDATPSFMSALRQKEGIAAKALEFLVLTATRSGEVRGACWTEIDLKKAIWTIPAHRMKAGKEHRVPLSTPAIQLLESLPRFLDNDLVFPAPRGGILSDMTLTAVMRRMQVDAVPHGFRSTFRDWCAERTHYPREMAEFALAHTLDNKTEAAYLRTDMLEKRRAMMQEWANTVTSCKK